MEERARQEREREESEAPVGIKDRGSAQLARALETDTNINDMEDEVNGLEEEGTALYKEDISGQAMRG